MAAKKYIRIRIELAIPCTVDNVLPAGAIKTNLAAIKTAVNQLKSQAKRINEGTPLEEATVTAVFHTCLHEFGLPCPPDQDISLLA